MGNVQNVRYNHIADDTAAINLDEQKRMMVQSTSALKDATNLLQTITISLVVVAGLWVGYEFLIKGKK